MLSGRGSVNEGMPMRNPFLRPSGSTGSFLPEDYVVRKAENRANLLSLALFGVVMGGVVAAFFVTNRQWLNVRAEQRMINTLYTQEAQKIEQLKRLEEQKAEMLAKAEVTTALIEKVPRSVLLAELITRMPEAITLLELELVSKKIAEPPPAKQAGTPGKGAPKVKNLSGGAAKGGKAGEQAKPEPPKAPKLSYTLKLVGVAKENNDIADYLAVLKSCTLLEHVELKYIKETSIDKLDMRKFEIECALRPDADARGIEPVEKLRNATVSPGAAQGQGTKVTADGQAAGEE